MKFVKIRCTQKIRVLQYMLMHGPGQFVVQYK